MTFPRRRRPGFTLVELLVVITILGVLVALLVPVIWGAVRRANDARVAGEINILGQALASFKAKFGDFPPSRIILVESGGYNIGSPPSLPDGYFGIQSSSDSSGSMPHPPNQTVQIGDVPFTNPTDADLSYSDLAQRSIQYLRKFFPRVQLSTGGGSSSGAYDFNGSGAFEPEPILLEGHECLVFFLGGIPNYDVGSGIYTLNGLSGFSASPTNPFQREYAITGAPLALNRIEPFYDFRAERLIDDDLDGIPGYIDPLGKQTNGRYFAYFSSYGGSGYDPNDVNFAPTVLGEPAPLALSFNLSFPVRSASGVTRTTTSPMPNPYTSSTAVTSSGGPASFINGQSYQIISAGRDHLYGVGGQYTESSDGIRLPPRAQGESRVRESDNITSFANGTLE